MPPIVLNNQLASSTHGIAQQSAGKQSDDVRELPSIGMLLGEGSQKCVFYSLEHGDRCVALIKKDGIGNLSPAETAQKEVNYIKHLESVGLPTVKTYGVVKCGDQYGVERGLILNPFDSQDIILGRVDLPSNPTILNNIIRQLDNIANILDERQIDIDDLQFLIDGDTGDVFISDPREVSLGNPQKCIDKTKELRGGVREILLDFECE
ncbi:hypothetical protein [Burkholderia ambifaria]|uniref:hypothetical protein n=1 Tax=Burkholderia ambifaria TaxID=152480 RepID=UPI00158CDFAD|nr:hypothetical protein [Burkholderia ambifaria]